MVTSLRQDLHAQWYAIASCSDLWYMYRAILGLASIFSLRREVKVELVRGKFVP